MDRKYVRHIFLLFLLSSTGSYLQASDSTKVAQATAEERLRPLVAEWQSARSITLDPRLLRALAHEFVHAQIVFAHPEDPGAESRAEVFERNVWLSKILNQHLQKMTSNPKKLKSFFARLGEALNLDPERSGWPSTEPNTFEYYDFSGELPDCSYLLISEGLPSETGFSRNRRFILGPGRHVIRSEEGSQWEYEVGPTVGTGKNEELFSAGRR